MEAGIINSHTPLAGRDDVATGQYINKLSDLTLGEA